MIMRLLQDGYHPTIMNATASVKCNFSINRSYDIFLMGKKKCLGFLLLIPSFYYFLGFIVSIIVNHSQSWSTMVKNRIVTKIVSIWKSSIVSTMVQRRNMTKIVLIWISTMVYYGPMWHCDKDCLNMKINHSPTLHCDKDCLNMKINQSKS